MTQFLLFPSPSIILIRRSWVPPQDSQNSASSNSSLNFKLYHSLAIFPPSAGFKPGTFWFFDHRDSENWPRSKKVFHFQQNSNLDSPDATLKALGLSELCGHGFGTQCCCEALDTPSQMQAVKTEGCYLLELIYSHALKVLST